MKNKASMTILLSVVVIAVFIAFLQLSSKQVECPYTGIEMLLIPAGEFIMGSSNNGEHEKPQHKVFLDAFYIDKYEISISQFRKFIEETGYKMLGDWQNTSFYQSDDHPVVQVSWWDVIKYCNWRSLKERLETCYNENTGECNFKKNGYRLPTETEWEKAARGTDGRKYPWGDEEPDLGGIYRANYSEKEESTKFFYTAPVDSYGVGKSPYGVYNMAGNVWEWCNDWYDGAYYKNSPYENPKGPQIGIDRVVRGGFWFSDAHGIRVADRVFDKPVYRNEYYGFRCVRTPRKVSISTLFRKLFLRILYV